MIDLHCHMLPGIDDGAANLDIALEMARIAVSDGISVTACTPHIYPGLFENTAQGIGKATEAFRLQLQEAGIPLEITYGADIQMVPELVQGLKSGWMPTLHASRYFLFEPPHHVVPQHFVDALFEALAAGYIPVITHPERLTWLDEDHYGWFTEAARRGAWLQVTAGALVGRFGKRAKYWGERFLGDGVVHILATDTHDPKHRPPLLSEGRDKAERMLGADEALQLTTTRPRHILDNGDPEKVMPPPGFAGTGEVAPKEVAKQPWFKRLFSGGGR